MKFSFFCFFFASFIIGTITSQELPPIKNFSPVEYGGENQNWGISQAKNKFIYVANNKGLLEYNGADWQLYLTPNETIIRSVKVLEDKIFTGFFMDFGYWIKNDFGSLEYTSIAKEKDIQFIEDEQIWEIVELDGWVLFRSLQRIYLYHLDSKRVKVIETKNRIEKLVEVEGVLYFQEASKGIFKIENGLPKLVSEDNVFKENSVINIFSKEGNLLFITENKGFYTLKNNIVAPWNIPANKSIRSKKLYSAKKLKNNDFALGTISDGLFYVSSIGELKYQITQNLGLENNTVLSIEEDVDSNLWLGLDDGISYVNVKSSFRIYKNKNSFLGTVYTSALYDEYLYLGTNHGVFYKKHNSNDRFKLVNNTQGQAWVLKVIDNELFCGHDLGTFIINKSVSTKIAEIRGTWDLKKRINGTLIQGNYSGLYILNKENNRWKLKNKLEGFNNSSRYFEILGANKILVNHEYKGVFKLIIDANFNNVLSVEKEPSIKNGIHSSLIKYNENVYFSSQLGIFRYFEKENIFKKDTVFSELTSKKGFSSGKLVLNKSSNKLWSFSKEKIQYLIPGTLSDKPVIKTIFISETLRKGASGFENIIHLKEKKYLLGTSNGYITVDLKTFEEQSKFNVLINSVVNFSEIDQKTQINVKEKLEYEHDENTIEIRFSTPNFNKITTTKYQYQLVGKSNRWSKASNVNVVLFENIPNGDYTFNVRGIVKGKFSENIASYSFKVNRPWYSSKTLIAIYVLLFTFLLYALHITSKRYYKKHREELLEKTKKESELKELESTKEIMKLNNEKLKNDIKSKNRELASSTMNMIKKNKFLNSIKTELTNHGSSNVDKVIKIIDKNLNNTDDWKMFQEAFNNADKKFLKKIKAKHKDLTPNDLRLCAYLRLNLSSKEIAPLLNISPRSVEVKRYRLRKKMDLPHDSNLTTYILEI